MYTLQQNAKQSITPRPTKTATCDRDPQSPEEKILQSADLPPDAALLGRSAANIPPTTIARTRRSAAYSSVATPRSLFHGRNTVATPPHHMDGDTIRKRR